MSDKRMVVAGVYSPACVNVRVAPELGGEWEQRTYTDADAPVVEVEPVDGVQAWADFLTGYNAAVRGDDLSEMTTGDMREGWRYCRQTIAAKANDFGEDWLEDDYSWIVGGC